MSPTSRLTTVREDPVGVRDVQALLDGHDVDALVRGVVPADAQEMRTAGDLG